MIRSGNVQVWVATQPVDMRKSFDGLAELVQPLVDLMASRVRQSRVIHTDETRVPVRDETQEGRCKSGRIWTYIGDRDHPYVVYDYTPDRSRAGPSKWLDKFRGYLCYGAG